MGSKKPKGPSREEIRKEKRSAAQQAWMDMQTWEREAEQDYTKASAIMRARMGASGGDVNQEGKGEFSSVVEKQMFEKYRKGLSDIRSGAAAKAVQQYHKEFGVGLTKDYREYATRAFGTLDKPGGKDPDYETTSGKRIVRAGGAGFAGIMNAQAVSSGKAVYGNVSIMPGMGFSNRASQFAAPEGEGWERAGTRITGLGQPQTPTYRRGRIRTNKDLAVPGVMGDSWVSR